MIPNRKTLVSIGLLVIAGAVQAATSITTCPFVITSPGDYVLRADLVCGGGDGITINTSNVRLALEGHRITAGVGANRAIVAGTQGPPFNPLQNVQILGPGLITNGGGNAFAAGVFLNGALQTGVVQSEVNGITVLGCGNGIVAVTSGDPDFSSGLTGLTITANTLGRNGTGISMTDVLSSTMSNNDVSGNGVGISIFNPSHIFGILMLPPLVVSHNIVNGNTGVGVILTTGGMPSNTVTVRNNIVSGNGGNGIQNAAPTTITDNTSLANGMFDLFDTALGCMGSVWSGNTFFTANQSCIH
jgi:hypothetical protein